MYHPETRSPSSQGEDVNYLSTSEPSLTDACPTTSTPVSCNLLPHSSFLSKVLADQAPPIKYPDKPPNPSSGARVLTSSENLERLTEKERRKEEAAKGRKEEREQKQNLLQEERQRKQLERERKKLEKEQRVAIASEL